MDLNYLRSAHHTISKWCDLMFEEALYGPGALTQDASFDATEHMKDIYIDVHSAACEVRRCEDRALDGPASGEKISRGRKALIPRTLRRRAPGAFLAPPPPPLPATHRHPSAHHTAHPPVSQNLAVTVLHLPYSPGSVFTQR